MAGWCNYGITNQPAILPFFNLAKTERVAIVGISDSNQLHLQNGWHDGFQDGMISNGFQQFGTGLMAANENSISALGFDQRYYSYNQGIPVGVSYGAVAQLADYLTGTAGIMIPQGYGYCSPTVAVSDINAGFTLDSAWKGNTAGNILFEAYYGTFPSGTGSFTLSIRDLSHNTILATGGSINTVTGAYSITKTSLTLAAGNRNSAIIVGQVGNTQTPMAGQTFLTYERWQNTDTQVGFSYGSLLGLGGKATFDMARSLQGMSANTLYHYFNATRDPLGSHKAVMVVLNSGANDFNTDTSVGPNPSASNTQAGMQDNQQAVINAITAVYTANGWDKTQLYFLLMGTHQVTDPDVATPRLSQWRAAADTETTLNPNTASVHLEQLLYFNEMLNGFYGRGSYYYNYPSDIFHMTQTGYRTVGAYVVSRIIYALPVGNVTGGTTITGGTPTASNNVQGY